MANIRQPTHSSSWYSGLGGILDSELSSWLAGVNPSSAEGHSPPIKGCKSIIAPHAGYSYSGRAAAWAYKNIDTTGIKRVFILGPSHHVYLNGCALSKCETYETPIGSLPLDLETIKELRSTGKFTDMEIQTDEDEHSIEMQLPYIRKVFEGKEISIVPILVGAIDYELEKSYGQILAPFLALEENFFVISSDFCHWGTRFSYTFYYPEAPPSSTAPIRLSRTGSPPPSLSTFPIHQSISALDHEAMEILTLPPFRAVQAHIEFADYLARTKNTICGRHPIGVLFGALSALEKEGKVPKLKWVRYEQSSQCFNIKDSSVSYASAYVTF